MEYIYWFMYVKSSLNPGDFIGGKAIAWALRLGGATGWEQWDRIIALVFAQFWLLDWSLWLLRFSFQTS